MREEPKKIQQPKVERHMFWQAAQLESIKPLKNEVTGKE